MSGVELLDALTRFFVAVGAYTASQVNVLRLETWEEVLDYWRCMELLELWKEETEQ